LELLAFVALQALLGERWAAPAMLIQIGR